MAKRDSRNGAKGELPDAAGETLAALLGDLGELRAYLEQRGRHTYELAQRFAENARRDPSSRAYDERQAAMLEYQHYIWHEIAGLVDKLLATYGEPEQPTNPDDTGA
jgi:hypothetical protein